MASNSEYEQQRFFSGPKLGWVKLGNANAICQSLGDWGYITWIPRPITEPELVKQGIEYFENLKTK